MSDVEKVNWALLYPFFEYKNKGAEHEIEIKSEDMKYFPQHDYLLEFTIEAKCFVEL